MRCQTSCASGFTLVEIMIVVAVIGLLVAIAVPNYMTYSSKVKARICFENLTQIESAKELWALQTHQKMGTVPADTDLFGPALFIRVKPNCPSGGTYDLMPLGKSATCTTPGHELK